MIAKIWLHDSAGAWLADVRDENGDAIADIAHAPGIRAPVGATLRIEGRIEGGASLVTILPRRWTVLEDAHDKGAVKE